MEISYLREKTTTTHEPFPKDKILSDKNGKYCGICGQRFIEFILEVIYDKDGNPIGTSRTLKCLCGFTEERLIFTQEELVRLKKLNKKG